MALYRHIAQGSSPGENWAFSLHSSGTISLQAAQSAWVSATAALWTAGIDAIIAPTIVMTEVSTAEIDPATGLQSSRISDPVTRPGVAAAETLPYQCATAVSLRTIFATRRGRGRFFLPPLAVSVLADARLSTAAQNTVLTNSADMMSALNGAGLDPVVYSRISRLSPVVTSIDVGDVIDTQRRRRNKAIEERVSVSI